MARKPTKDERIRELEEQLAAATRTNDTLSYLLRQRESRSPPFVPPFAPPNTWPSPGTVTCAADLVRGDEYEFLGAAR